ncbi:MAG: GFA family protein [Pontixanthobacter sp.]
MSVSPTGGCQCGAVRYRIAGEVAAGYACHCTECQRQSASAFGISVPVWLNKLHVTGELAGWTRSTDSGSTTECFFCPTCGVRVYHAGSSRPGMATIKGGTLDDARYIPLIAHIWVASKQDWLKLPDDVPSWATQPGDMAGWATLLKGPAHND